MIREAKSGVLMFSGLRALTLAVSLRFIVHVHASTCVCVSVCVRESEQPLVFDRGRKCVSKDVPQQCVTDFD